MTFLDNLLILLLVLLILSGIVIYTRRRLLKLWRDVSVKEVLFHKYLLETTQAFYSQKVLLKREDNQDLLKKLSRYQRKPLRKLLLKERQDLFLVLNILFNEIELSEQKELIQIKKQFQELQKIRRLYNSKVLLYNQTISLFPTRFLAMKMNLKIKEYFG